MQRTAAIVIALVMVLAALFLYLNYTNISHAPLPQGSLDSSFNATQISVTRGTTASTYYAYIATTIAQQERGYMFANSTGDCRGNSPCIGMLFAFQNQSNLCFWMENTHIPLEQSWIAQNGLVTYTYYATVNSTASVCGYGTSVLETAPAANITVGDVILQN